MEGFFKANRSEEALELALGYPKAFILLYFMACRARRHGGFNRHGLAVNECFLGDYAKMGLSEREYRTAKMILEKHGFATFRATNKGTIGTITNTKVWDINAEQIDGQGDEQETNERRTSDGQETTNEEVKNVRRKEVQQERASEIQEVVDAWNQSGFPSIRQLSGSRRTHLCARLADPNWKRDWRPALERAKKSDFLNGGGSTNWRANFDWFCRPDSVLGIMEGKYDNKTPQKPKSEINLPLVVAPGRKLPGSTAPTPTISVQPKNETETANGNHGPNPTPF